MRKEVQPDGWVNLIKKEKKVKPKTNTKVQPSTQPTPQSKPGAPRQTKKPVQTKNQANAAASTALVNEDEELPIPAQTVDIKVGVIIQRERNAKKMTQKDLATLINERPKTISDYEAGNAPKDNAVLAKLERALGVKLRGKDIGTPLQPKK